MPAEPENRLLQAQALQRLVEGARRVGRHPFERFGDIELPEPARCRCVACGQRQHRVDGLDGALQELGRRRVSYAARSRSQRGLAPAEQSLCEYLCPVGANVADRPQLVQRVARGQLRPLLGRVDGRNGRRQRASEDDAFVRLDRSGYCCLPTEDQVLRKPLTL